MAEFKMCVEFCWNEEKGLIDLSKETTKTTTKARRKVPATPTRRSERVKRLQYVDETQEEEAEQEEPAMELN